MGKCCIIKKTLPQEEEVDMKRVRLCCRIRENKLDFLNTADRWEFIYASDEAWVCDLSCESHESDTPREGSEEKKENSKVLMKKGLF